MIPSLIPRTELLQDALLVAEHLSFRQAAEQLGVRPSAVSRRVRALEDQLGITLFERHSAGVRPTIAGQLFFERARWSLAQLDYASRDATRIERGEAGVLGVSFYSSLASGLLHRIFSEYRIRAPDLDLSFVEGPSADQLAALRRHCVDVAFLTAVENAPGAESEHLWDESVYVGLPEQHPLAACESLSWVDLREYAFVVRAYGSGPVMYTWLAARLSGGGYAPNISQHDVCRESLLGLVGAGYALTVVSQSATALHVPGVVFRPISDNNATMSVRMAWLRGNQNPALGRFLSHARRIARHGQRLDR